MEENDDVILDSSPEQEVVEETPNVSEDVNTPIDLDPVKPKSRVVPYDRFQEVVQENKKLKESRGQKTSGVDALDFIKLGKKLQDFSDEEIDFATKFANSKSPEAILDALSNDMVQLAISAKREKVEKEKLTLRPNNQQPESDAPSTLEEKLNNARSNDERQKILEEMGLYSEPRRTYNSQVIRP